MRPPIHPAVVVFFAVALGSISGKENGPASQVPGEKPIQIPRIAAPPPGSTDWEKQAHQVLVLNPLDETPGANAELALAWTPAALLLQVRSDDATPVEAATAKLWTGDSIEIFLSSPFGSEDRLQVVATPGRTAEYPRPRWQLYIRGQPAPVAAPCDVRVQKEDSGYAMTFAIPWANLKHAPQAGDIIGLQVFFNDAQSNGRIAHRTWSPRSHPGPDYAQMQRVRLSDHASPPETATAQLRPQGFYDLCLQAIGTAASSGGEIAVWSDGRQVASGKLAAGGAKGSSAAILLPRDLAQNPKASVRVLVAGQALPGTLQIPDLAARRLDMIKSQPLVADPAIFDGDAFPKIDFLNKDLVEAAIGPYSLQIRFFDAGWKQVAVPGAPGRYGALVEFRAGDGMACERHLTLFKTPHPYQPAKDPYDVTIRFPAPFDLPSGSEEQWNISNWVGGNLENMARRDQSGAVLVAALRDLAADPARWHGFNVWRIDDDWWAELQKRLGASQEYPHLTYLPDGYDKDQRAWPLLLFLHGAGERGNNLDRIKNAGPLVYIHQGHPLPFIVVSPQCPEDEWWNPERLMHLIDEVSAANRIDPKRIYLTGLSMGGYGTWDLAARYPGKFAAIAPVAGGETPGIAERLKGMPTWVFHGSEDDVVPTRYSLDIVQAMQKLGAPVKLTIYPGVGHGGWDKTYTNPELYSWFLEHSK